MKTANHQFKQFNINTELDIFALGGCRIALGYFPTKKNILKNLCGGGQKNQMSCSVFLHNIVH